MAKVLIVDDDQAFRNLLIEQVQRLEHEVEGVSSLEQGRDLMETFEPVVVFLDVNLPDGSGLDAIESIKAGVSSPEVIIVTAEGEVDGASLAIESGAWDYLQKGYSLGDLVMPLRHAVEYRRERLAHARTKALDLEGIVGSSPSLRRALDFTAQAAGGDTTVLVTGETGTGKELFARAIHRNSDRREGPFIVVDCAALPENLVESMLFGHRKGAFTGADKDREGMVRFADGGTLFLDEVGEMPPSIQKAFLRVLQEKRFRPVGGEKEVSSDFRLVAATNRDINKMTEEGTFRKDLLFRIRGHAIELPPLRERGEDVVEIAQDLITRLCRRQGRGIKGTTDAFFKVLRDYSWPGNVRELNHALERALAAAADQPVLYPIHLPMQIRANVARGAVREDLNVPAGGARPEFPQLKDAKKTAEMFYLKDLMAATGGDIDEACRLADVSRSRLYALLKEHGIIRPA